MILCHLSIRNVVAVIQILLLQITLGLALPTAIHNTASPQVDTRQPVQTIQWNHNINDKRAALSSNVIPKITGGAVAMVLFGLIIGLGSASIAIFGSLEWEVYRGKKKEEPQEKNITEERGAQQDKHVSEEKGKPESLHSDSDDGSLRQ